MFVEVYGAVLVKGESFYNEEMVNITFRKAKPLYGIDWVFDGDQGFEEANIYAAKGFGHKIMENKTFYGRQALPEFLAWAKIEPALA